MSIYSRHFNTKNTPQTEPVPGVPQIENNAGGFVFKLDPMAQLRRFLILGTEGGTYYAKEKKLTKENCENTIKCIQSFGEKVVTEIVAVSTGGRAVRNDAAIFALCLASTYGDKNVKQAAYRAIPKVCRTGTHLFSFCESVEALRGWSRGLRTGVSSFYLGKTKEQVAYQIIKYRQRNGWTHRDVLRLCHAKSSDLVELFKYAVGKAETLPEQELIQSFEKAQKLTAANEKEAAKLITDHKLPWEALPTELLKSKKVWEALIPLCGITALIRNLGRLSAIGVTTSNLDSYTPQIVTRLTNEETLTKGRVHPLTILNALRTYSSGHGEKGSLSWKPVTGIVDALNDAFYLAFKTVTPTNQNWMLGLDVSGSMDGSHIAGMSISAREASAAMAMITAAVEPHHDFVLFGRQLLHAQISKNQRLDDVIKALRGIPFGGTDCSLPILFATKNNLKVDTFVIYTDSETWAGNTHPFQALKEYRNKSGVNAKLVVVGMCANNFTIADPRDPGMLDVVGFDTATPQAIAEFSKG